MEQGSSSCPGAEAAAGRPPLDGLPEGWNSGGSPEAQMQLPATLPSQHLIASPDWVVGRQQQTATLSPPLLTSSPSPDWVVGKPVEVDAAGLTQAATLGRPTVSSMDTPGPDCVRSEPLVAIVPLPAATLSASSCGDNTCHPQCLPPSVPSASVAEEHSARSQKLLDHLAEFTCINFPERSPLPVEFQMTIQLLECMSRQGQILSEVNAKMEALREDVHEHMDKTHTSLKSNFDNFYYDLSDRFDNFGGGQAATTPLLSSAELPMRSQKYLTDLHCKKEETEDTWETETGSSDAEANNHEREIVLQPTPSVLGKTVAFETMQKKNEFIIPPPATVEKPQLQKQVSIKSRDSDPNAPSLRRSVSAASMDSKGESRSQTISGVLSRHISVPAALRIDGNEKNEDYWLRKILTSTGFDLMCAFVIVTNAFTIGATAEQSIVFAISNPGKIQTEKNVVIGAMNKFYISFYVIELCCKLHVFRASFFYNENAKWNIFDLILVLTGVYELMNELTPMNVGSGVGVTWLRVLRIIKTLKLLRVIRVMRFFQVLRTMVSSIAGSLNTLMWAILMISIIMYMFGLCFLQAATIYLTDTPVDDVDLKVHADIVMYWGSVQQSMMTLFWAVTGGADWEPLADPIRKADSFFYGLFFFYIAFAALAVLNVLTGMFVDTAMKIAQQDEENVVDELIDRPEIKNFRKHVMTVLKDDCPGFITFAIIDKTEDELKHKGAKQFMSFMKLLEIETEDCRRVFRMMDTEKKGFVDLEEFIKGCFHVKGSVSGLDMIFLMSETKNVSKHQSMSVSYFEERFDELYKLVSPEHGASPTQNWKSRLDDHHEKKMKENEKDVNTTP